MEAAPPQTLCPRPPVLDAIVRLALHDAEAVAEYVHQRLAAFESKYCKSEPLSFSPTFLIGIGVAIRLRHWELRDMPFLADAGLPTAEGVLTSIFNENCLKTLETRVTDWHSKILRSYCRHIVWSVQDYPLQAELAVVAKLDDAFLDAVADFLLSVSNESSRLVRLN